MCPNKQKNNHIKPTFLENHQKFKTFTKSYLIHEVSLSLSLCIFLCFFIENVADTLVNFDPYLTFYSTDFPSIKYGRSLLLRHIRLRGSFLLFLSYGSVGLYYPPPCQPFPHIAKSDRAVAMSFLFVSMRCPLMIFTSIKDSFEDWRKMFFIRFESPGLLFPLCTKLSEVGKWWELNQ